MESARSMMDHAGLPDKYWAEAVECAAYIRNRLPTTALREKKTPCTHTRLTEKQTGQEGCEASIRWLRYPIEGI